MPDILNVNRRQPVQRYVNVIDSDYHYDDEKHKRNVQRMMTGCKKTLTTQWISQPSVDRLFSSSPFTRSAGYG
ncbi:hypothetical protein [[Enterobacter] lignolyticus]|uniref:hypothetical protein n=1 Tax=[Enterobacter] lignolyticus TaxID=1334193 RepID=UPI000B0B7543|nr:hypothetical protein [[Enterobacter] lignolyticus]